METFGGFFDCLRVGRVSWCGDGRVKVRSWVIVIVVVGEMGDLGLIL